MTTVVDVVSSTGLGGNQGYRFDGDFVHLNADVNFGQNDLGGGDSWALQLWASSQGFDASLNGVKVAELALQAAPGSYGVAGCVSAMPPAGKLAQVLGLALVSIASNGHCTVRDLSVFPNREVFVQPQLQGEVTCECTDGFVNLKVAGIANPRPTDTLSGTLVIELWSIDAPYTGGSWIGKLVKRVDLGVLAGGASWTDCQYSIPAELVVAGRQLTLMLREWTSTGYVTRDFRNLSHAAGLSGSATPSTPMPVLGKTSQVHSTAAEVTQEAIPKADPTGLVAVNRASEAEIASVKGIGASLARAIVAARPFASMEDLCRAKGMGPRLLKKVRARLSI